MILGGLAALHEITGDRGYLEQGESIAGAALRELTSPPSASPPGILVEPDEATAAARGDQTQFKGIFVRYLYEFYQHSPRPAYREVHPGQRPLPVGQRQELQRPVRAALGRPFDQADASRQSSRWTPSTPPSPSPPARPDLTMARGRSACPAVVMVCSRTRCRAAASLR